MDRYEQIIRISPSVAGVRTNISATASSSPVLSGFASAVLLWATSNCWLDVMPSTASVGTGMYLAASQYVVIAGLASQQISVVQDATAGTLYIKPLVR